MTGRRRTPRFLLASPVPGTLLVREEVLIEAWGDGEIRALSAVPYSREEELVLELPGDEGERLTMRARESMPVVGEDGQIRYRLLLALDAQELVTAHSHRKR